MIQRNKKGAAAKEMPMEVVRQKMKSFGKRVQTLWAEWMSRRTARMSKRTLYVLLALFVLGGTVYNTLVLSGIWKVNTISNGTIAIPKGSVRRDLLDSPILVDQQIKSMLQVRASLDSLKRTREGRAILDSIARKRPGLLDSLRSAEEVLTKF